MTETESSVDVPEENVNYAAFRDLCSNNAEYFCKDTTENGQRLYLSFMSMKDDIDLVLPLRDSIESVVHQYDYDEATPGNGYRSFLKILDSAIVHGIQVNKKVCLKRDSVLFRKSSITKEVEACAQLMSSVHTCLKHLQVLRKHSAKNELFAMEHSTPQDLIRLTDDINQYCFYGRPLGFQFTESIRGPLRFISLSMAIFSEAYYSDGSMLSKATNSVMTTTKYVSDPEQRAKRVVNIGNNADVDFCKAFWFLSESELMQYLPSIVAPSAAICKTINIPTEPITLNVNDKEIDIPIPMSHIGSKSVHVRLISYEAREGMVGEGKNTKMEPPSRGLLIHCHGGGFVSQSSKSHEVYLRQWAKELRIPILSIDYSLAPSAPYPRALEEIMYAYAWALKNCQLLGSTGERIIGAGDSAGANLLTAMSLKCIEIGVPTPHGLFLAYMPTYIGFIPSPARLLCKLDPLLPFGFLTRCLKAYVFGSRLNEKQNGSANGAISPDTTESFEEISESDLLELQAHKSPTSEMSDTLTYGSLTSQTDDTRDLSTIKEPDFTGSDTSQKFDLLDKFVLDSDTDTDGTKIAVLKQESVPTTAAPAASSQFEFSLQGKVTSFVSKLRGRMSNLVQMKSSSSASMYLDVPQNPIEPEVYAMKPTDPYISPYCASDELLKQLPPMKIFTVHLDPCLDDCVSFAKRVKNLGNDVNLTILDGLPHGFLNFSLVCKEAYDAAKQCAHQISDLFDLDSLPPQT